MKKQETEKYIICGICKCPLNHMNESFQLEHIKKCEMNKRTKNAGCDRCGVNDRIQDSKFCAECSGQRTKPMTKPFYSPTKSKSRSYGYSIQSSIKQEYIIEPENTFGWYRYKRDAVKRCEELNKCEVAND